MNNSIKNELNVVDVQSTSTPSTTQSQTQPSRDDHNFISPVQHKIGKRKRAVESDSRIDEAFAILKKTALNTSNINSQNLSDECTTYGLLVGNKIRNYQPKTRSLVQHYINNILFEADMGKYDFNSTTSNCMLSNNLESHYGSSTILLNSPQPPSSASSSIDPSDGCSNDSDMSISNYYNTFLQRN